MAFKKIEDKTGITVSGELSKERLKKISQRAHELYEARGRDEGHHLEDWLRAEAEIDETQSAAKE